MVAGREVREQSIHDEMHTYRGAHHMGEERKRGVSALRAWWEHA